MRFFCIGMHSSLIRGLRSIKCSSQIILLYFMYEKTHAVFHFMQFKSCTKSKISWVFSYIKYSKFWSFSLEHFIESKPRSYLWRVYISPGWKILACSLGFSSAICPLHFVCNAIYGPKKYSSMSNFWSTGVTDDHNSSKWPEFTQNF